MYNQCYQQHTLEIKMYKTKKRVIALFILPSLFIFTLFIIYPLITTVYRSFFEFNGFKLGEFLAFENFTNALKDPTFLKANLNTIKMLSVQLFICGPFSYLLALLLIERKERFRRYFKIAVFLPAVLNVAVIALMWKMMLQPQWGMFDFLLINLGLESLIVPWLSTQSHAIWIIGFVTLWQYIGFNMLYFYASLKSIPESYYEAAKVEGANFWYKTLHISIPLSQEMIKFVLIISITGTMQIFTQIQLMTDGGPGDMTRSIIYQMYYTAFSLMNFGEAGAIAIIFALQTFALVLIVNKFVAKDKIELT